MQIKYAAFADALKKAIVNAGWPRQQPAVWNDPVAQLQYLAEQYRSYGGGDHDVVKAAASAAGSGDAPGPVCDEISRLLDEGDTGVQLGCIKDGSKPEIRIDGKRGWSLNLALAGDAVGKEDFYRLAVLTLFPCVNHPVQCPLWDAGAGQSIERRPWSDDGFADMRPVIDGEGYFWGWRSDRRAPADILEKGFKPKLLSASRTAVWDAVVHAVESLQRARAGHVWFRYGPRDLCTESSIAVASRFPNSVIFPDKPAESQIDGWPELPPAPRVLMVRRGGAQVVQNVPRIPPQTIYVYAVRVKADKVHDTCHLQHGIKGDDAWAELATERIESQEVLFAVEVGRWGSTRGDDNGMSGWFQVTGVHTKGGRGDLSRYDRVGKLIREKVHKQIKDELGELLPPNVSQDVVDDLLLYVGGHFAYEWRAARGGWVANPLELDVDGGPTVVFE
ncbi:MAG: hypothetical protein ACYTKD_23750 [Planctomycetota bacterium]|jgi:hypothetical protein